MLDKLLQSAKAKSSIVFTLSGIITPSSSVQSPNAYQPMVVTPSGIVTDFNFAQV